MRPSTSATRTLTRGGPGYGLTIQQGGTALKALGIADAVTQSGSKSRRHLSYDSTGSLIGAHGQATRNGAATAPSSRRRSNVHLPRQALRELLLSRLRPDTVRWGRALTAVREGGEHVELSFEGVDAPAKARVVVGADGIRSAVRAAAGDDDIAPPLAPLEVMVILGFARSTHPLCADADTVFEVVDGSSRLYCQPFDAAEGTTMWQFSFPIATADAAALRRCAGLGARGTTTSRAIRCLRREKRSGGGAGWMSPVEDAAFGDERPRACADDVTGYPRVRNAAASTRARCSAETVRRRAAEASATPCTRCGRRRCSRPRHRRRRRRRRARRRMARRRQPRSGSTLRASHDAAPQNERRRRLGGGTAPPSFHDRCRQRRREIAGARRRYPPRPAWPPTPPTGAAAAARAPTPQHVVATSAESGCRTAARWLGYEAGRPPTPSTASGGEDDGLVGGAAGSGGVRRRRPPLLHSPAALAVAPTVG